MKKIILALALLATPTALSACSSSDPVQEGWERGSLVRTCRNGAMIVRDSFDGRLIVRQGWTQGYVAPGVSAAEACD